MVRNALRPMGLNIMSEPEQTPMERAAEYKRDRKARGLTQTQLAALVGVRQATISDRETGAHEFGQEAVMALRSIPLPSDYDNTRKAESIISELREWIDGDAFDCLEDKMEALELLADFDASGEMRECSLCSLPGSQGRLLDECTGADMGRCEPCKGLGFVPVN